MARWIDAGRADELAPGHVKVVRAGRRQFAVCNVENSFYCIDDVCTHDGGPLDQGELDGVEIECPRHGARFDVTTGQATCLPAIVPVQVYPVRIENGEIQIQVD
jgi:3-phenylpropionate/trans-cinnamate dioxygenase ferredoxin subunit